MPPLIKALRPQEWIKNLLVFAGRPVLAAASTRRTRWSTRRSTFVAFCAISSAGYLLNDLRDREHDRRHPEKRHRPIASGELSPRDGDGRRGPRSRSGSRSASRYRRRRRGRRARRALRRDHDRLLAGAQAAGDHRRDDDRLAVHPPGRRRRGRGRGPRLGVPARLHRRCSPSSSASPSAARRRCSRAGTSGLPGLPGGGRGATSGSGDASGARALLDPVPRSDGRDGHRRGDHQLRRSTRSTRRSSARRCSPPRPRSSTGSSATST